MKKRRNNIFNNIISRYIDSFKRLLIPHILNICFGLFACYNIFTDFQNSNLQVSICIGFTISFLSAYIIYYYSKNKIINNLIPILLFIIFSIIFYLFFDNLYIKMIFIGIIIIMYLLFFHTIYYTTKGNVCIYYSSKSLIVLIVFLILSIGLSICTLCFSLLLFESIFLSKLELSLYVILYIFCLSINISFLPKKNEKLTYNKIFIIIYSCIPLFVYYLLIVIIYIYIFKIIITWTFPVGVINPIASLAYLLYIYFSYVSTDNYKISRFHQKFGSYLIIPIFIVQQLSIFIRVFAYGLTMLRLISIIFNILSLLFVILSLIDERKYFLYICSVVILVFTSLPYINFIDLPVLEQEFRLKRVLVKNEMLKENTVIYKDSLNNDDKQIIISCCDYLKKTDSNIVNPIYKFIDLNLLNDSEENNDFSEDEENESDEFDTCIYFPDARNIDISNYSKFDYFDIDSFNVDDPDFINFCLDTYAKYGNSLENGDNLFYINDDSELFVFDYLNFHIYIKIII